MNLDKNIHKLKNKRNISLRIVLKLTKYQQEKGQEKYRYTTTNQMNDTFKYFCVEDQKNLFVCCFFL